MVPLYSSVPKATHTDQYLTFDSHQRPDQLTRISCSVQIAEAVSSLGMYLEFHTAAIGDNEGLRSQSRNICECIYNVDDSIKSKIVRSRQI